MKWKNNIEMPMLFEGEQLVAKPFKYTHRDGTVTIIKTIAATSKGRIFERNATGYEEKVAYVNTVKDVTYKRVHLKINGKSTPVSVHTIIAQFFLKNYTSDCYVVHRDNNPFNNEVNNLQCVDVSTYRRNQYYNMSFEEQEARAKSYGEAVSKGHAKGNYDEHLEKLHADMRARIDSKA